MSNLKETQQMFQEFLLHPGQKSISQQIINPEVVSADIRLSVYGDAYRLRLVDGLAVNFPFLQTFLGDQKFTELAHHYITLHPSTYRSIRWYGDNMPAFLREDKRYADKKHLAEIAQLDWIMDHVFDARDADVFQVEEMAQIAPESWPVMCFTFHPSVHRQNFDWNVVECWRASKNDEPFNVAKHSIPANWVFWRQNLLNKFGSLAAEEAHALDAALAGNNFAEICEGLLQFYSEEAVAAQAATMLKSWMSAGLITKVNI